MFSAHDTTTNSTYTPAYPQDQLERNASPKQPRAGAKNKPPLARVCPRRPSRTSLTYMVRGPQMITIKQVLAQLDGVFPMNGASIEGIG